MFMLIMAVMLLFLQLAPWKIAGEVYFSFLNSTDPSIFLTNNEEIRKLYFYIKDFSVLTQLSARLSSLFTDQGILFF